MSSNVVQLSDHRQPLQSAADPPRDPAELAVMSYPAALDWAGADSQRLAAVAKARDYRPEWISHQLENQGVQLSAQQIDIITRMVAAAGPYLSRRQRWVVRQLKAKPTMSQSALVKLASKAAEFRQYKHVDRCVANDIAKLVARNLIRGTSARRVECSNPQHRGLQTV
jgi:hypothetical protein